MVVLERSDTADPPSIECVWTTLGWYLTRRGEDPTDVAQGRFPSRSSAIEALVAWATRAEGWEIAPEFRALDPQPLPEVDVHGHRWVRSVGSDGQRIYFYEFNADGMVVRSVELKGPAEEPRTAASLVEWREAQRGLGQPATPAAFRCGLRFGSVPEGIESDWGDYPRNAIGPDEFDEVWARARDHLLRHPRGVW